MPSQPDTQLLLELKDIKETLRRAPAMNGGFDRLLVSVENIKEQQKEVSEKIERLYDPESGTFARLASIEQNVKTHKEALDKHKQEHTDNVGITSKNKIVIDRLQSVAGEHLDDLDAILKFRKNFDKLYWLMIAGITSTVIKMIFDILHK